MIGRLLVVEADVDNEEFIDGAIIHVKARPINTANNTPIPTKIHFFGLLVI
jgi:hypothetical protein